mmetsp:Transcript_47055/g.54238  ORF Transcript_47055/g.54238 Transcript_47055/m.54238 type:complete len:288 (-) Transcript_47055:215-1078(-)
METMQSLCDSCNGGFQSGCSICPYCGVRVIKPEMCLYCDEPHPTSECAIGLMMTTNEIDSKTSEAGVQTATTPREDPNIIRQRSENREEAKRSTSPSPWAVSVISSNQTRQQRPASHNWGRPWGLSSGEQPNRQSRVGGPSWGRQRGDNSRVTFGQHSYFPNEYSLARTGSTWRVESSDFHSSQNEDLIDSAEEEEEEDLDYENLIELEDVKTGLSVFQISALPRIRYKRGDGSNDCETNCTICLVDFEPDEELTITQCLHRFHDDCITRWFKDNRVCPVCHTEQKF